ncbi:MAG: TlpA family protein disulfide reductase [Candidatus Egerieousia sp.]
MRNSFYGQLLTNQITPKGLTGTAAADFDIIGADGKRTKLSKAVKGKKAYIIDFWASWCAPCRKEIPNLKAIYERFRNKGLEIISISIDKNDAAWKKALAEEKLAWPNGIDKTGINDTFNVKAIPAIFIVDGKTNTIVAEKMRGEQLADKIAEMLE